MEKETGLFTEIDASNLERQVLTMAQTGTSELHHGKTNALSIFKRYTRLLLGNLDKRAICLGILEIVVEEIKAENGSLWLVDHSGKNLILVAARGYDEKHGVYFPDQESAFRSLKIGHGAIGWVAQRGESLVIEDVNNSEQFIPIQGTKTEGIKSLVCLPISDQDGVIGVLNLSHPDIGAFTKENEQTLALTTDMAALAFTNYFLYTEAQTFSKKLEQMITERTRDLRQSQERFDLAVGTGKVGVWDWDLETDAVYMSGNLKSMLGYQSHEITSAASLRQLIHPDDKQRFEREISDHLEGRKEEFHMEIRRVHRNGEVLWFLSRGRAIREGSDHAYRMAGSDMDITELKQADERLLYEARHDSLTGLPNRAVFKEWVTEALQNDERFAVFFFDLDRFRLINDSLGHAFGDHLIQGVSRRCEDLLRESDLFNQIRPRLARLGGDEFALITVGNDDQGRAERIAASLQNQLSEPFHLEGHEIVTTASVGIVLATREYGHPEELIRDADAAMNQAKSEGKARYRVFKRTYFRQALSQLLLEQDLRKAVKAEDQITVFYQPIVDLRQQKIAGFEALARWRHPTKGLIMPKAFIPIAEETGLIVPIGEKVLRKASADLQRWRQEDEHLCLSVNLSSVQFKEQDLSTRISTIIAETGLPPEALHLELTESMLMSRSDFALDTLRALRAQGSRLLLDDFGTGYSSLNYLHRFPIDTLKIDRSFVSGPDANTPNMPILRTITLLAEALGMESVAEGIETEIQLRRIEELGCRYGQGFFFSPPLESSDAELLVKQGFCRLFSN